MATILLTRIVGRNTRIDNPNNPTSQAFLHTHTQKKNTHCNVPQTYRRTCLGSSKVPPGVPPGSPLQANKMSHYTKDILLYICLYFLVDFFLLFYLKALRAGRWAGSVRRPLFKKHTKKIQFLFFFSSIKINFFPIQKIL